MATFKSRKEYSSRLARQEAKRFHRQTYVFVLVSLAVIAAVIFVGIPALIKVAVFLGDLRQSTTPITEADTIPPTAPQLIPPPEATNSANLEVQGFAESGATVSLYVNNSKAEDTISDAQGQFSFNHITLQSGDNQIYAIATDKAGNVSPPSSVNQISVLTDKPTLTVTDPLDNQQFVGPLQRNVTISGHTEPANTLQVNDSIAVVTGTGDFKYRTQLNPGDNHFTLTATDPAGNSTTLDLTLKYSEN